jgi:hypothetical protein
MNLDAVKARLGSIGLTKLSEMPNSVQHLLTVDLPNLIAIAEIAAKISAAHTVLARDSDKWKDLEKLLGKP